MSGNPNDDIEASLNTFASRTPVIIGFAAFGIMCMLAKDYVPSFFVGAVGLLATMSLLIAGSFALFCSYSLGEDNTSFKQINGDPSIKMNVFACSAFGLLCIVGAAHFAFHS